MPGPIRVCPATAYGLADAKFIVRACNAHAELVTALEAMQQAYYDFHDAHSMTQPATGRAANANTLAIEALIKAKGE